MDPAPEPVPTKRIVLPSGRTIEVVVFGPGAGSPADLPPSDAVAAEPSEVELSPSPGRALHECPSCASTLVYPATWEEAGRTHWRITLRCPECEWTQTGDFSQEAADRFDEALEDGTDTLIRDLRRLTRVNMTEDVDRLIAALHADAIQPMDF